MHPIHDVDVLLLLATALASKRRPAELVEIVAAADLVQGSIPAEAKLVEAFSRLATQGLIGEVEGRFTLTPAAQEIMAGQPRKADAAERVFAIKEKLAAYEAAGEQPAIVLAAEQLGAAIRAHRTATRNGGRNLLMPKLPAGERDYARQRQWRRKPAVRKGKA